MRPVVPAPLLFPLLTGVLVAGLASAEDVQFADVTEALGIDFRHAASPTSQKYLPETMGAGVALFDADGDGRLDVYFVNGARLDDPMPPGAALLKDGPRFWNRLYRQGADGRFEDADEQLERMRSFCAEEGVQRLEPIAGALVAEAAHAMKEGSYQRALSNLEYAETFDPERPQIHVGRAAADVPQL